MKEVNIIRDFMRDVRFNKQLFPSHISLYVAILSMDKDQDTIKICRKELMKRSKITSIATYHKCIKDLVVLEYINYSPSYHPAGESRVKLRRTATCKNRQERFKVPV